MYYDEITIYYSKESELVRKLNKLKIEFSVPNKIIKIVTVNKHTDNAWVLFEVWDK